MFSNVPGCLAGEVDLRQPEVRAAFLSTVHGELWRISSLEPLIIAAYRRHIDFWLQ